MFLLIIVWLHCAAQTSFLCDEIEIMLRPGFPYTSSEQINVFFESYLFDHQSQTSKRTDLLCAV